MIVVFDGIDRSGKTTTMNALHKKTNYKFITIDRVVGYVAYDRLKNRQTQSRTISFMDDINTLTKGNTLFVYMYACIDDIYKRMCRENPLCFMKKKATIDNIYHQELLYRFYFEIYVPMENSIFINSSELTTDEIVNMIIDKTDELERVKSYESQHE